MVSQRSLIMVSVCSFLLCAYGMEIDVNDNGKEEELIELPQRRDSNAPLNDSQEEKKSSEIVEAHENFSNKPDLKSFIKNESKKKLKHRDLREEKVQKAIFGTFVAICVCGGMVIIAIPVYRILTECL